MFGWRLIRITGDSMTPTLPAGAFALFRRQASYRKGDIVAVNHGYYGRIIKRICELSPDGGMALAGDGATSVSSEQLGHVEPHRVIGRMVWSATAHAR